METRHLNLPFIAAAQAQKHITHNEALRKLDALVQLSITSRALNVPPAAPVEGTRFLVADNGQGLWAGQDGKIAAFQDGGWLFYAPVEGWLCWTEDEAKLIVLSGAQWLDVFGENMGAAGSTPYLGVNAVADDQNRLVVSAANSLFNHEGASHQVKVNKASVSDTAALLFQDGFSGRSEIGLTGDDDLHFKVSADGTAWKDALIIDKETGVVSMPYTPSSGGVSVSSGTYTPTLGGINTNSYAGATGLTLEYARYTLVDTLCSVRLGFSVDGLTSADLLAGSTLTLQGLPFAGKNLSAAPVDQFAAGSVFRSIGGAKNTLLGGYCAVNTLYLFTFALANNNAKNTDKHFVSFSYEIEAP